MRYLVDVYRKITSWFRDSVDQAAFYAERTAKIAVCVGITLLVPALVYFVYSCSDMLHCIPFWGK